MRIQGRNYAFIDSQKNLYRSFLPCFCRAIGEMVYFTADGLHHLLYCKRRPRKEKDRLYRASLIPHVSVVIVNSSHASRISFTVKGKEHVVWAMIHQFLTPQGSVRSLKVIVRRIGNGKVHFLSAMDAKVQRKIQA